MKKLMALMLTVLFGGAIMMVAGCAPKQESAENSAPAMEEAPAVDENAPAMDEMTPSAEAVPAEEEAMPQE